MNTVTVHGPGSLSSVLSVSSATYVAEIKAAVAHLASSPCLSLVFRGRDLEDLSTLKEYGVADGAVLACAEVTTDAAGRPMPPVAYAHIAAALKTARELSAGGQSAQEGAAAPPLTGVLVSGSLSPPAEEWEDGGAAGVDGDGGGGSSATTADVPEGTPTKYSRVEGQRVVGPGAVVLAPRHPAASTGGIAVYGYEDGVHTASGIDIERLKKERRDRQALVVTGAQDILPADTGAYHHPGVALPTRTLQSVYTAKVGGLHTFHVLHRMEGRWTGEAECLYPHQQQPQQQRGGRGGGAASKQSIIGEVRVCTTNLAYDDLAGVWVTSQALTTPDGLSSTQRSVLRPVADGRCVVQMVDDHLHSGEAAAAGTGTDWRMSLCEQGDNVILITAASPVTGRLLMVETVTLLSDMARTRVIQRFNDKDGTLRCTYVVYEDRVLDAVTGAVMSGPPRAAAAASAPTPQQQGEGGRGRAGSLHAHRGAGAPSATGAGGAHPTPAAATPVRGRGGDAAPASATANAPSTAAATGGSGPAGAMMSP